MLVRHVNIVGTEGFTDIRIQKTNIEAVYSSAESSGEDSKNGLLFGAAIAFPGIINSHDHLDFNLFPRLGNRIYRNYTEWARDIHSADKKTIDRILHIPQALRIRWGVYKNLISGITTVVNHGKNLSVKDDLITVFQHSVSLHSPAFEKNWRWKINAFYKKEYPVVIHLGEGTDQNAGREIDRIIRWNLFKRKIIAIHGVAMNTKQASSFKALIWCPASNYFLLDKTADIHGIGGLIPVMLGTDSTLTASWNFWEHLRLARKEKMVTDEKLLNMLGSIPAKIWGLEHGGHIGAGYSADLVIASAKKGMNGMNRFFDLNPEDILMVIHEGRIRLFDETLLPQLDRVDFPLSRFSKIAVNGRGKYVAGDLPGLMQEIRKYDPDVQFPVSAS